MILLVGMVWIRVLLMRRKGIRAFYFGRIDKKDFLIPPFAFFYLYVVFAAAFDLPSITRQKFFHTGIVPWVGVFFCLAGLFFLLFSLVAFGKSFRIGIDEDRPGSLITTGVFAYTRNPVYVAFSLILLGQFMVFSNWILLVYLIAAIGLFNRQVLREEDYLRKHYGQQYSDYCERVRRYL